LARDDAEEATGALHALGFSGNRGETSLMRRVSLYRIKTMMYL
jgi:hypothetical protein